MDGQQKKISKIFTGTRNNGRIHGNSPDKLHKSLKVIVKLGMKIFIPFPRPSLSTLD